MPKREHIVFVFLIAAITLAVYFDSFNNSFVYDDYPFLVDNPAVRQLTPASVLSNFTEWRNISSDERLAKDVWRPLVTTSFAIDYKLWKLNSRYYHIENTFFHIINAILVYAATVLVLGSPFAAFIAAVVFAIHPVQTEAVTWVSGRSNVLFLLFFLLAFISHLRNRLPKPNGFCYPLALVFFLLSLLSKEMAIVLPLLCLLYDIYFIRIKSPREYVGYYAPFLLIAASYLVARLSVLGVIAQTDVWWGGGPLASAAIMLKALAAYVAVVIFPVNLRVEHPMGELSAAFDPGIICAAAILSLAAAFYAVFRRKKEVSLYVLWFFAALAPVYNIVPIKAIMAERFLYLPVIGFASLFGILFAALDGSKNIKGLPRASAALALTFVIIMYGVVSIGRNMEWRDELAFYMNEAARAPLSPKAHYNLGYICAKEAQRNAGDRELAGAYCAMAVSEFGKTISLKPDSRVAYVGMGNAFNSAGMYEQAAVNFRKALAFGKDADTYNNLGVAHYRSGDIKGSEEYFRQALRMDPGHPNALINMGNVYFSANEFAKAKRAWSRAISMGGKNPYVAGRLKELEGKGF
jgi:tetratricopeptide (TPR) repeat protein